MAGGKRPPRQLGEKKAVGDQGPHQPYGGEEGNGTWISCGGIQHRGGAFGSRFDAPRTA